MSDIGAMWDAQSPPNPHACPVCSAVAVHAAWCGGDDESDVHAALARIIATIPGATAAHSEAALAAVRPYLRRPAHMEEG